MRSSVSPTYAPVHSLQVHVPEPPSWEQDYSERINPTLMTTLLRDSVPVLDYADWRVTDVRPGFARSLLPLNYQTTDQHGSHQATLMTLAADYTGGLALATALRGVPVVGVHPTSADNAMLLWLLNIDMSYQLPSTGDLTISCAVPEPILESIGEEFWAGKRSIYTLEVAFSANGEPVASAQMTYFLQHAGHIRPRSAGARVAGLYRHKLKASARLVAGVRALADSASTPGYNDPYSEVVAGKHGALLARRFTRLLPQLQTFVAVRSRHIDDHLLDALANGVEQVVTVGVGLDCRPFRVSHPAIHPTFYELDLPEMLTERERALSRIDALPYVHRVPVPLNLEHDEVFKTLQARSDFDPQRATFVIFEGGSMYLEPAVAQRLLASLVDLLNHPRSRLWVDFVAGEIAARCTRNPEVAAFVNALDKLGERFRFGHDDPAQLLTVPGRTRVSVSDCAMFETAEHDCIFDLYHFVLVRPDAAHAPA